MSCQHKIKGKSWLLPSRASQSSGGERCTNIWVTSYLMPKMGEDVRGAEVKLWRILHRPGWKFEFHPQCHEKMLKGFHEEMVWFDTLLFKRFIPNEKRNNPLKSEPKTLKDISPKNKHMKRCSTVHVIRKMNQEWSLDLWLEKWLSNSAFYWDRKVWDGEQGRGEVCKGRAI